MHHLFRKKTLLQSSNDTGLAKELGVWDLTALGVAALVGAGIFSTIGQAAYDGGPAVSVLFIVVAISCLFSALCYAEFASTITNGGSAYTYSYVAFGELVAWIIGWDLIIEYAIGNIAVAISWSGYFVDLMAHFKIHIPAWLTIDYRTALDLIQHQSGTVNPKLFALATQAYTTAPELFGLKIILNLPAFGIVAFVTFLTYIGIKETKLASNIMVLIKMGIVLLVLAIGSTFINPENWTPFAPNGLDGVLKGISAVFFAFIGFDTLSTTTEECKDPKRDLPRAILYSLIICTILYVCITLVVTGVTNYKFLKVADPLLYIFEDKNMPWLNAVIGVSAVVAMASVILVFQIGQPRIWMSMSRDGLLPSKFSEIHPKFKTPWFATLVSGAIAGIPALFLDLKEVTDLCSFGTIFAFLLVCIGVLVTDRSKFSYKMPVYSGRIWTLVLLAIALIFDGLWNDWSIFSTLGSTQFSHLAFWALALPFFILILIKDLSLIPCLGVLSNWFLMCQTEVKAWERFGIWLAIGLVIYFLYSKKHSLLNQETK